MPHNFKENPPNGKLNGKSVDELMLTVSNEHSDKKTLINQISERLGEIFEDRFPALTAFQQETYATPIGQLANQIDGVLSEISDSLSRFQSLSIEGLKKILEILNIIQELISNPVRDEHNALDQQVIATTIRIIKLKKRIAFNSI